MEIPTSPVHPSPVHPVHPSTQYNIALADLFLQTRQYLECWDHLKGMIWEGRGSLGPDRTLDGIFHGLVAITFVPIIIVLYLFDTRHIPFALPNFPYKLSILQRRYSDHVIR